ncbi:MFS transporter [Frankia sp. Cppng1_Ct_nod]|uniref:MFS transporter n=1 Tax=Frankia sp. Cppng1_Ct_nod TaxID=2897162 RepID=UPI0010419622|nr:MFS transporter [Frankia sp. Cppng1_Ct_nod]
MGRWNALVVLGAAQFLMVLDASVMNVSITQLVEDFDTEVTAIQAVITLYSLVMAAFTITGGKLGDLWGRRRAFTVGIIVYGVGSLITATAPTLGVLTLGWSVIEGLGAALVLPALVALVGGNYSGRDRAVAFAVIGGLAGAGIAVGPLLGGWATTALSWRVVFAGEAVVVAAIVATVRWVRDTTPVSGGGFATFDTVGAVLSALGLALVVLGILQSSSWGWLRPKNSPVEPLGFALTPFVVGAGFAVLVMFHSWERHREETGRDPLVRFTLLEVRPLRSGLSVLAVQNVILLGVFFIIPLYLQIVQGFDALQTGLRLLPVSATMLLSAMSGPLLGRFTGPRRIVRMGLLVLMGASLFLVGTVEPHIDDVRFAVAMAVLGIGMGLLASQLGNVVQSAVGESSRSQVGGLQYTAQNFGSAVGTALMGAIVISGLAAALTTRIADDPRISEQVRAQAGVALESGVSFVSTDEVRAALANTTIPPAEADALVAGYADAQLAGLKAALLAAAGMALVGLAFTHALPTVPITARESEASREPALSSGAVPE